MCVQIRLRTDCSSICDIGGLIRVKSPPMKICCTVQSDNAATNNEDRRVGSVLMELISGEQYKELAISQNLRALRVASPSSNHLNFTHPQLSVNTTMFGLRKVVQTLPVRNAIAGSQFLNKAAQRSFASGVSKSIDRHGTTILVVRKDGKTVMAGDGQVSAGSSVVKGNAKKVRRLGDNILVGFAGSTADALTLLERLEKKLEEHPGQLTRACVELAKAWRSDKYLRRLEAVLLVADDTNIFELTGNGDVLEPEHGVMGVGSGGSYAQAAALALVDQPGVGAEEIVRRAMKIAGDICVYTNHNVLLEIIDPVAIALAKKEKEEKEIAEKENAGKPQAEKVAEVTAEAAVAADTEAVTPPADVIPTKY